MYGGQLTTLSKANNLSESLRTTVPASVIKQFELKEGDKIRWVFYGDDKGMHLRLEPVRKK